MTNTARENLDSEDDHLSVLRAALLDGEGVLILGQDHSPDVVDRVLSDAGALFGARSWTSIPGVCTSIGGDDAARHLLASLFEKQQPPVSLLELSSLPWTSVVTTAVDPLVSQALLNVGSQRRVIELAATQLSNLSGGRSPQVLHLIRAFGVLEGTGVSSPPTSSLALAEARMIRLPAVLAALPRIVGLHGMVVIEGITPRDWLDEQGLTALTVSLSLLPSGRVFWFGPAPESVRTALTGRAVFYSIPFQEQLRRWTRDETLQAGLRRARDRVFGIGEHVITVVQDGRKTPIALNATEWRAIGRIGSLLDDVAVSELLALGPGNRNDLVAYLRRSHAGVPDWKGPARGLIFEREQTAQLIKAVLEFLGQPKGSVLESGEEARGARRLPFIVGGPPAVGKTMALLHTAWTLRAAHNICVVWLVRGVAGIDLVAVERLCRLLESRGAAWTVLVLDSGDPEEYLRLKRRLESEGRRIVVIGAVSSPEQSEQSPDTPGDLRWFGLRYGMNTSEKTSLTSFLEGHRIDGRPESDDFLSLLAGSIPETEFGALPSLLQEYEGILNDVRRAEDLQQPSGFGLSLGEALRNLFPNSPTREETHRVLSVFEADPLLKDLLGLVFFCAHLDRPIPVDLLFRVLGSELVSKYALFNNAFSRTALVEEVDLDSEGTLALAARHQLYAIWLLKGLLPAPARRLDVLHRLAMGIDWDKNAYPGENPYQDFVLDILRAVGPRGEYKEMYQSREALKRMGEILRDIRESFAMDYPKLLTAEAIVLGDLAVRETSDAPSSAKERCQLALALLGRAEELLRQRRATDARAFELQKVLTLSADIRGTLMNVALRHEEVATRAEIHDVLDDLSRIEADAVRAQSYAPSYHPLDVAFWAHRDAFDLLPDNAPSDVRVRLVESMGSILEVATEEPLDASQKRHYDMRRVDYLARSGKLPVSQELARRMRERGDYSGEISLSRYRVRQAEREGGDVVRTCREEMERLLSFRPGVLAEAHAARFLHSLWTRVFVKGRLGDGTPKLLAASTEEWRTLGEVIRARLASAEEPDQPYAMFFLGWCLYQLDEPREAREVFFRLERQALGNPRRVGELSYLTREDGSLRTFQARVTHPRAGQVRIAVPAIDADVMDLRPEVETQLAPAGLVLGQYIDIAISLNYRGPKATAPGAEQGRRARR